MFGRLTALKQLLVGCFHQTKTASSILISNGGIFNSHIKFTFYSFNTFGLKICRYPIPIHTTPLELDHVLYGGRPCERFQHAFDKYHASETYKKEFEQFKPLSEYLEKHSGVKIQNFKQINRLYNTLWIEQLKNKTYNYSNSIHF